jgi:mannose-1-phosphate guanylyltransferase
MSDYIGSPEEARIVEEEYDKIDGISIDYGILEKTWDVYVMESSFSWDDIGNWTALERYIAKDENGNSVKGTHKVIDSHNCIDLFVIFDFEKSQNLIVHFSTPYI